MSQTLLQKAFGVSWHYEYERTDYMDGTVQFHLALKDKALICPRCRSAKEVIRKGRRCRILQTVPIGLKPVYLVSEVARCRCRRCQLTFEVHPPLPGRTCAIRANLKRWLTNSAGS
jgi:Zn finger protein HypA/HybF involved in hydrogenase expression